MSERVGVLIQEGVIERYIAHMPGHLAGTPTPFPARKGSRSGLLADALPHEQLRCTDRRYTDGEIHRCTNLSTPLSPRPRLHNLWLFILRMLCACSCFVRRTNTVAAIDGDTLSAETPTEVDVYDVNKGQPSGLISWPGLRTLPEKLMQVFGSSLNG